MERHSPVHSAVSPNRDRENGALIQECTLVYPYFNNPDMLRVQVDNWNKFGADLTKKITAIVVDDCSDYPPVSILRQCKADTVLLRFREPGLWTMHEARNLGAFFSGSQWPSRWLFMSDIDLLICDRSLHRLLNRNLCKANYYTFNRILAGSREPVNYHANSYLVASEVYERLNGYDVDLCGLYGGGYGGDRVFVHQLEQIVSRIHLTDIELIAFGRVHDVPALIADADTTQWDRAAWNTRYQLMLAKKIREGNLASVNPVRRSWERLL